jgi:hypothetical protein
LEDFEVLGRIVVDSSGATSLQTMSGHLGTMQQKASGLGATFSRLGGIASVAIGGLITSAVQSGMRAVTDFAKGVVEATEHEQKTFAQLNAVLSSTKGVSGMTADSAEELAKSLSSVTTFGKNTVLESENMLLTFTQIGKDVFPGATEATLNMAQALGEDVTNAAMQLGKALNEPIQGVTALRRVGVQLTDEQEKQVKAFMEVGDVASAQKIILAELTTEFGGSAAAAADTYAGRMQQLHNKMNGVKEAIGEKLLPVVQDLTEGLIGFITGPGAQGALSGVLDGITTAKDKLSTVGEMFTTFGAKGGMASLAVMFGLPPETAKQFGDLGTSLEGLFTGFSADGPKFQQMFSDMMAGAKRSVIEAVPGIVGNLKGAVDGISKIWKEHGDEIMAVINVIWKVVVQVVVGAVQILGGIIRAIVELVSGVFDIISKLVHGDWKGAWDSVVSTVKNIGVILKSTLLGLFDSIAKMLGTSWAKIVDDWKEIWRLFKVILAQKWEDIKTSIKEKVEGFIKNILDTRQKIIDAGKNFLLGFLEGIVSKVADVITAIKGIVAKIVKALKDALGSESPAKLLIPIGATVSEGLAVGIMKAAVAPVAAVGGVVNQIASAASTPVGAAGALGGGAAGSIVININGAGDPAAVAREVYEILTTRLKVNGVLPQALG